ncbi:MAG: hypothetical protein ACOYXW_05835, partial [Actinomycetota bacterium]
MQPELADAGAADQPDRDARAVQQARGDRCPVARADSIRRLTAAVLRYRSTASGAVSSPVGSTCTRTPSGTAAMSRRKRCRRATSSATMATSHGRVGACSGRSRRPTCSTNTVRAPSVTARPSGTESTIPPSRKCS